MALLLARRPPGTVLRLPRPRTLHPEEGHRFNPAKLVIDPYAKAITGPINGATPSSRTRSAAKATCRSTPHSAGGSPKCVVVDNAFTWENDRRPAAPWNRTVIYECHVQGMTMKHPECRQICAERIWGWPPMRCSTISRRWRDRGRAAPRTPVHHRPASAREGPNELLGVQLASASSRPTCGTRTRRLGNQVYEFKSMVKTFHAAGIEVILDVVYNHTARATTWARHCRSTASTTRLLPPRAEQALLHRFHGHRQQPEHAAPAHDPVDHG